MFWLNTAVLYVVSTESANESANALFVYALVKET